KPDHSAGTPGSSGSTPEVAVSRCETPGNPHFQRSCPCPGRDQQGTGSGTNRYRATGGTDEVPGGGRTCHRCQRPGGASGTAGGGKPLTTIPVPLLAPSFLSNAPALPAGLHARGGRR